LENNGILLNSSQEFKKEELKLLMQEDYPVQQVLQMLLLLT